MAEEAANPARYCDEQLKIINQCSNTETPLKALELLGKTCEDSHLPVDTYLQTIEELALEVLDAKLKSKKSSDKRWTGIANRLSQSYRLPPHRCVAYFGLTATESRDFLDELADTLQITSLEAAYPILLQARDVRKTSKTSNRIKNVRWANQDLKIARSRLAVKERPEVCESHEHERQHTPEKQAGDALAARSPASDPFVPNDAVIAVNKGQDVIDPEQGAAPTGELAALPLSDVNGRNTFVTIRNSKPGRGQHVASPERGRLATSPERRDEPSPLGNIPIISAFGEDGGSNGAWSDGDFQVDAADDPDGVLLDSELDASSNMGGRETPGLISPTSLQHNGLAELALQPDQALQRTHDPASDPAPDPAPDSTTDSAPISALKSTLDPSPKSAADPAQVPNCHASRTKGKGRRPDENEPELPDKRLKATSAAVDLRAHENDVSVDGTTTGTWLELADLLRASEQLARSNAWLGNHFIETTLNLLIPNSQLWQVVDSSYGDFESSQNNRTAARKLRQPYCPHLVLPINFRNTHWTIAILDIEDATFELYDPLHMAKYYEGSAKVVREFIKCLRNSELKITPPGNWEQTRADCQLRQNDQHNCGLYCVAYVLSKMFDYNDLAFLHTDTWRSWLRAAFESAQQPDEAAPQPQSPIKRVESIIGPISTDEEVIAARATMDQLVADCAMPFQSAAVEFFSAVLQHFPDQASDTAQTQISVLSAALRNALALSQFCEKNSIPGIKQQQNEIERRLRTWKMKAAAESFRLALRRKIEEANSETRQKEEQFVAWRSACVEYYYQAAGKIAQRQIHNE